MSNADFVISPYGRGNCSVCGREFNLTKKGKVRTHGAKDGTWPPMNCSGAGRPPAEDEEDPR